MFGPSLHIVGLRQFSGVPARVALQRFECAGMVQVNHRVELLRQAALKVMAPALGFRAVYDTDGALETLSFQQRDRVISLAQIKPKVRQDRSRSFSVDGSFPARQSYAQRFRSDP